MAADTGFTLITATRLVDGDDNPLVAGIATFTPVITGGIPTAVKLGGNGTMFKKPVSFPIVQGVLSPNANGKPPQLPDVTQTTPANIGYSLVIIDTSDYSSLLGPGYDFLQPSGPTWNFDDYVPNLIGLLPVQTGPQGLSDYQLWAQAGNTGTLQDFINSLKGSIATTTQAVGQAAPYNIPGLEPGAGNLYVTIPGAFPSDTTHTIVLPHPCDQGTKVAILNTGTGIPLINLGNGTFGRPRQGEVMEFTCIDAPDGGWAITGQFYLPPNAIQQGDTGTVFDGLEVLYWTGNADGVITIEPQSVQGRTMRIVNFGANNVTVANASAGSGVRNVTGDLIIPSGGSVVIETIETDFYWLTASSPVIVSSVPATSIIGVLNSTQIPGLDASKITSGVFDPARIPGGGGGSGGVTASVSNLFTAPQVFAMGPTTTPGITLYGDSITNGAGATVAANTYANLVKQQFNGVYLNLSQGGDEAADLTLKAHADSIPTTFNPTRTVFIGHNDVFWKGATATALNVFTTCLTAALSYLAIPNYYKAFGQAGVLSGFAADHSFDPGGGEDPTFKVGMAVTATAQGSTVTLQVTTTRAAQAVYIGWLGKDGNGGTASVTIDGTVVDNITTQGPGTISTQNGRTETVWGKRYVVANAGVHTIVITVTSATATGNSFTFLWAGTPAPSLSLPGMPRVFVLDPLYQAAFNQQAVTDAYIAALSPLVSQLAADGLYVARLVTNNYIDNATDMAGTVTTAPDGTVCPASTTFGLHPNDCGMQHIANMITGAAMPTVAATPASITLGVQAQAAGVTGNLNSPLAYIGGPGSFTLPVGVMGSLLIVNNTGTGPLTVATKNGTKSIAALGGAVFVNQGDGWVSLFG